jgi:hypothetical protein
MGRPVMARPAISAPTTARVEPVWAGLWTPPALQLNMEVQRGLHAARPVDIRTLAPQGIGKGSAMTMTLLVLPEESLQLPVR